VPGISIHVVDISRGIVARGMRAELWSATDGGPFARLLEGEIDDRGVLAHPDLDQIFGAGRYRAVFHVGAYYRSEGIAAGAHPFLDVVHFDFGISAPAQHVHLPFKCTPWGYSCFRGGA
jgi:5-hydroxyisourate hydrolase